MIKDAFKQKLKLEYQNSGLVARYIPRVYRIFPGRRAVYQRVYRVKNHPIGYIYIYIYTWGIKWRSRGSGNSAFRRHPGSNSVYILSRTCIYPLYPGQRAYIWHAPRATPSGSARYTPAARGIRLYNKVRDNLLAKWAPGGIFRDIELTALYLLKVIALYNYKTLRAL